MTKSQSGLRISIMCSPILASFWSMVCLKMPGNLKVWQMDRQMDNAISMCPYNFVGRGQWKTSIIFPLEVSSGMSIKSSWERSDLGIRGLQCIYINKDNSPAFQPNSYLVCHYDWVIQGDRTSAATHWNVCHLPWPPKLWVRRAGNMANTTAATTDFIPKIS